MAIISLFYLFLFSIFGRALKNIEADELKKFEKAHPNVFVKLQKIYDENKNLETLFSLAKLCVSILVITVLFFFLQIETYSVNTVLMFSIYALIVLASVAWFFPKRLLRDNTTWILRGMKYSAGMLNLFMPIANKLAPPEPTLPEADVSLEDLKTALPDNENNSPSVANLSLYKQVLRFDKILIQNVMRPKTEIVGIKANYNFKEVLSKINSTNFSRLPVYDGSWNNILGIIHCKDLLPFTHQEKLDWNKYIRPIVYVQPTDLAQEVLRIFQHSKNHMAIVKDAFGKIVGIVTLEDITEEIIGEIDDE